MLGKNEIGKGRIADVRLFSRILFQFACKLPQLLGPIGRNGQRVIPPRTQGISVEELDGTPERLGEVRCVIAIYNRQSVIGNPLSRHGDCGEPFGSGLNDVLRTLVRHHLEILIEARR